MLDSDPLNTRATQLQPWTRAAPLLVGAVGAHDGMTPMVHHRVGEVAYWVQGYGRTRPLGHVRIHIAFHMHTSDLTALCRSLRRYSSCLLSNRKVKDGNSS